MNDVAYAAGIIDGEGTITLSRVHRDSEFRRLVISVTNTSPAVLEFMRTTFGGCICTQKVYKAHYKPSASWRLRDRAAMEFLRKIRPFLREEGKCARADLVLTHYSRVTKRNGKYSSTERVAKLDFERAVLET